MPQEKKYMLKMPEELHTELKTVSAQTGVSMKDLINISIKELIRQYEGEGITIKEV